MQLTIVWQIPTALAQNIETIIITRFLAGFSGAAFLSVSGGSITDMWIKEQVSWPMVIYTLGPFLGPTIGPLVGGFINQHVVWRWTFYVILMWGGLEVYPRKMRLMTVYRPFLCARDLCAGSLEAEGQTSQKT
jgi:MFS family permease